MKITLDFKENEVYNISTKRKLRLTKFRGGRDMDNKVSAKLNLTKIKNSGKTITTKEALKDVTPIKWHPSIINGEQKVEIRLYER